MSRKLRTTDRNIRSGAQADQEGSQTGTGAVSVYLDCNATTPLEPRVQAEVFRFLSEEFGNAGSRTHEYGTRAKQAVQRAREQVAAVVESDPDEVIFTSGATESDNIALLGLAPFGEKEGRRHVLSTQIEHKAVLEPLEVLSQRGFDVELIPPNEGGWINPEEVRKRLRSDTLLVSVMHVNNETGVIQPIEGIAEALGPHPAYLHVDAAQGFGKELEPLRLKRIDLIAVSAHKIYGPKGIGALIARRRKFSRPPLTPLMFGGGQERNLRPGTLPVPLVVGLGLAAELAVSEHSRRAEANRAYRKLVLEAFAPLGAEVNGDTERCVPHTVNLSVPGLDSEAAIVALKGAIAISNGSACTSQSYKPSHVLNAMGLPEARIKGALRISWCHMTKAPSWEGITRMLARLLSS